MKILVVGDWHSELHEEAVYQAFSELNHNVLKFAWHSYFKPASWLERASSAFLKAQNKYLVGPRVWRLNAELVAYAVDQSQKLYSSIAVHISFQARCENSAWLCQV